MYDPAMVCLADGRWRGADAITGIDIFQQPWGCGTSIAWYDRMLLD